MPVDMEPVETGVLLGSGLSSVGEGFDVEHRLRFDEIPGVGAPSVVGHRGEILTVRIGGRPCCFILGRRHYYEGDAHSVDRLVDHLYAAGVRELVVTSAAGSLDESTPPGEFALVDSVLDLQFRKRGARPRTSASATNTPRTAPANLQLADDLRARIQRAADGIDLRLNRGTLASLSGPAYETPSEIRALRSLGPSLVSMSGAPETVAANALGMQVAIIAVVTNWAAGISTAPLSHEEVLTSGQAIATDLRRLITQFIKLD